MADILATRWYGLHMFLYFQDGPMEKRKDLLLCPFIVESPEETTVCRTERGFSLHFSSEQNSKFVNSAISKETKNYIILDVTDGTCKAIYETKILNIFKEEADFYIPVERESTEFYTELYDTVMNGDAPALSNYTNKIHERLISSGFPPHPLPMISTARHFSRFAVNSENNTQMGKTYCTKVAFGDEIPTGPPEDAEPTQKARICAAGFAIQDKFFKQIFTEKPIWSFHEVSSAYDDVLSSDEKNVLSRWHLKSCLVLHAYFCVSGPWRHLWIPYGYDPSKDPNNYKFQCVAMERGLPVYQVAEIATVVKEVERNKDWYLRKECHPTFGFISEALRSLISISLSQKDLETNECGEEQTEDSL